MRRSSRIENTASNDSKLAKNEAKSVMKLISSILKKETPTRSVEELGLLQKYAETVNFLCKRKKNNKLLKEREQELEDDASDLESKCKKLASVIEDSRSLIIYSGAGISTAASIPDYRGPQGVWTLLKQGKECRTSDLSLAEPTFTHMAIGELHRRGYVKRVVSQNCDGLHLRSGLPQSALSELHGNMFLELCRSCQPIKEYVRLFDVTEKTGMRRHKTGRLCHTCRSPLQDTIVHFGEKSPFQSPHNWQQATNAANRADVILCLGSSLKVLKKYACLWASHKPITDQPRLIIVNLQWTPKDKKAYLKINGRCDDVMGHVTKFLNIRVPLYNRHSEPLFHLAIPLLPSELRTTSKAILMLPEGFVKKSPEELRYTVHRRKRAENHNSSSDDKSNEEISLPDEDSFKDELVGMMLSHYHGDDSNCEVRRQPIRAAKVKQFLTKTKRKFLRDYPDKVAKFPRIDEAETVDNTSNISIPLRATPKSMDSDNDVVLVDDSSIVILEEESVASEVASLQVETFSSQEAFLLEEAASFNTYPNTTNVNMPSHILVTGSIDSASDSSSVPFEAGTQCYPNSEQCFPFSVCPTLTPPLSNGSSSLSIDYIITNETSDCLNIDCDYANVEEICEMTSDASQSSCIESQSYCIESHNRDDPNDGKSAKICPSLTTPGWFGKGVQVKKPKRRKVKKLK